MLLANKNAVIYGAAGSLGSTIAKAFAVAGAKVFVTGRNIASVQLLADEINQRGGYAVAYQVDALDAESVDENLETILKDTGSIDISYNAVGYEVIQGKPLTEITPEQYVAPVTIAVQTHFITMTAAARTMMKQQSGVILSLSATPGGIGYAYTGGFSTCCAAIENLTKNLAAEIGAYGVRAINMRSGGSPDSKVFCDAIEAMPDEMKEVLQKMKDDTMLKKLPMMQDIANTAVFLCSDLARMITGVTVDITAGTTAGLNYRAGKFAPKF